MKQLLSVDVSGGVQETGALLQKKGVHSRVIILSKNEDRTKASQSKNLA